MCVCMHVCTHAQNPPSGVKLCMEAVCIMKGLKADRKPDPNSGKMVEDFWGPSLKLLGDLKFLESLKTYDKDNINPAIMKRIREKWVLYATASAQHTLIYMYMHNCTLLHGTIGCAHIHMHSVLSTCMWQV